MKKKIIFAVSLSLLSWASVLLSGCCTPTGTFATTEEHTENLGASVQNIFLDGDGIN